MSLLVRALSWVWSGSGGQGGPGRQRGTLHIGVYNGVFAHVCWRGQKKLCASRQEVVGPSLSSFLGLVTALGLSTQARPLVGGGLCGMRKGLYLSWTEQACLASGVHLHQGAPPPPLQPCLCFLMPFTSGEHIAFTSLDLLRTIQARWHRTRRGPIR